MNLNTIYVNPDDINDGFWDYNITLVVENVRFIVNANNLSDALDYVVDYCEENLINPGLLVDPDDEDECMEHPSDYMVAGNHSRMIRGDSIIMEDMKRLG